MIIDPSMYIIDLPIPMDNSMSEGMGSCSRLGRSRLPQHGQRVNVGAYQHPFSGVGLEFAPLLAPPHVEITLHETGYWAANYGWDYPNVFSPFWRILYDYEPGHFVDFDHRRVALSPDYLLVIPDHQRHSCSGDSPVPSLWFLFSCPWSIASGTELPLRIPLDRILRILIREFPKLFQASSGDCKQRIQRLSLALITYVLGDSRIPRRPELPADIASVVQAIDQRPEHSWKNTHLAAMAGKSTAGFIRAFRRWVGETPIHFVLQTRIRKACQLLLDPDLSMDTIARITGFSDRYHFGHVFKKQTGLTPAKYRKQHLIPVSPPRAVPGGREGEAAAEM